MKRATARLLSPLTTDPAVEELETGLGLVVGNHVATAKQTHEGEVAGGLDLTNLLALVLVIDDFKVFEFSSGIFFVAAPLKSIRPGLVAEPVADKIGITSVDEDRNLLKDTRDKLVERFHPVTLEKEVAVDVKVARVEAVNFSSNSFQDLGLIEVGADELKVSVAETAVLAGLADIVDVLASALIRTQKGVVAVDRSRNTSPSTFAVVARLNHGLAATESIVHRSASALVKDGRVTTIAASHGPVVFVLSEAIGETVSDQDRLQVDVALLVGENLRSKGRNVVTGVRFTCNVEILGSVFGELFEEEGKKSIDILCSSARLADGVIAVGETDIDGLIKEDDRSVRVPRVGVVDGLNVLADRAGAKLEEKTGQGRASWATVQPEDDGVSLGVVSGLKEP